MRDRIEQTLRETAGLHLKLTESSQIVEQMAERIVGSLGHGGALYVMGNGGSAADSQHMAGELAGRFLMERPALPCHALTTDTSLLTAVANDYGFDEIFTRQIEAYVRKGDAVLGISTSGNSRNVNAALAAAREKGAVTLGLTGRDGGEMPPLCDVCLVVPCEDTPRVQEAHQTVIHVLCDLVERALFGGDS